jgi:hypothetical protein
MNEKDRYYTPFLAILTPGLYKYNRVGLFVNFTVDANIIAYIMNFIDYPVHGYDDADL